jgi:predicted metal-dependent phosphoesterase TrpH
MTEPGTQQRNRQDDTSFWPVDLHAHTTASDGLLAPVELVDLAASRGLRVLAVTDHDTVDAIPEATARARAAGLTLVPGVELSTTERGSEVHVLGYGVDPADTAFLASLADLAASRYRRIAAMIEKLRDAGYAIDGDAVLAQAESGSIGRPHVARALIAIGEVDTVSEAFERFLKPGRPGWVPRDPFTPEEAVGLLVEHGALPVLAHPFSTGNVSGVLERLQPLGLRGIEVWYGEYDDAQRQALREIAEARGLGSAPVPYEIFERLVDAGMWT